MSSDWVTIPSKKSDSDWVTISHPPQPETPQQLGMGRALINFPPHPGASSEPAMQALLERSGQIIPTGIQHGPGAAMQALLHGVPQQQYEADVRKTAGLPPTGHGAELFFNEMALDLATYFGIGKAGEKLTEAVGPRLLPMAMGIAKRFAKPDILGRDPLWVRAAAGIHDFFTPGGQPVAHAFRRLAETRGAQGVIQGQRMESAAAGGRAVGSAFAESLKSLSQKILKGTTAEQQSQMFSAIHRGMIDKLPEELAAKAEALQNVDRSVPYVMGTGKLKAFMRDKLGFKLPEPLKGFDTARPRGLVGLKDFRTNHVPTPHGLGAEEAARALQNLRSVGGRRGLTDIANRYFQQRLREPGEDYFSDPRLVNEVWNSSFDTAGRQMTGAMTRQALFDIFGTPGFSGKLGDVKLLTLDDIKGRIARGEAPTFRTPIERGPATAVFKRRIPSYVRAAYAPKAPTEGTWTQELLKQGEALGNLGKSTLFYTPFPHQRNIGTLGLLANPAIIPKALYNYARMGFGFAGQTAKDKVLGEAMRAGATGMPNVEQRGLTQLLDNAAQRLGKVAGIPARVASWVYKTSGKMLWTMDEATKASLFDFAKKRFNGDIYRAASYVRKHLVDYGLTSPAQDYARLIFPFSTWRPRMPQAVALSLFEHPEYGIAFDRLTHGAAAGAPFQLPGSQKKYQSSSPLAEAGELIPGGGEQHKYLRSSLSLTSQVAADIAAKAIGQKEVPFPGSAIESRIPIAGQAMQYSGHSPYGDTAADAWLYLLTGIHPATKPARRRRPPRPRLPSL